MAGAGHSVAGQGPSDPSFPEALGLVDGEFEAKTFPGAALVVTRRRKIILERYWGTHKSWDRGDVPCHAGMVHMLYSFSKLITSTVVVMAHQDGLFDYDAPVSRYIPGFVGGGKEKIAVRHLLTHSAGLPGVSLRAVDTEEKWRTAVGDLCDAKIEWAPGSRTVYHGITGHFLAAEVVRRCSGMRPWESICRERLFEPLGAGSLTFRKPGRRVPVAITPQSSDLVFGPDSPDFKLGAVEIAGHPAGGAFGTAADLLKVLHLHLSRGEWQGKTLIRPGALDEMHSVQYAAEIRNAVLEGKPPSHQPWGLGILLRGGGAPEGVHHHFGIGRVNRPAVFGHAGIGTIIGVADPDRDAAVVFLTTDTPKPGDKVASLRSGVVGKILAKFD